MIYYRTPIFRMKMTKKVKMFKLENKSVLSMPENKKIEIYDDTTSNHIESHQN